MEPDGEGVDDVDLATVRDVLADHPVGLGVLFGSRVRGTSGDHSDVDVAVEFDPSVSGDDRYRARIALVVDLTRALGTDDVDVVDLDGVRPEVGRSALDHGLVIVGDPNRADRLSTRFERRATRPSRDERRERFDDVLARLEEKA